MNAPQPTDKAGMESKSGLVRKLEFRIPMSPTSSFFHQARFFNFCLRRLGGIYAEARILMVVGDNCDIDTVREENAWSEAYNIEWRAVPRDVFDRFGIHGTADYRLTPETDADLVILSDADTVLARDIDPLLQFTKPTRCQISGHMAHLPPPPPKEALAEPIDHGDLWPFLFDAFGVPYPRTLYKYSMDPDHSFPLAPAYFNLGFVALTPPALRILNEEIFDIQDKLMEIYPTFMRCQIACSLAAYKRGFDIYMLGAEYNAANDVLHMACNNLDPEDARVIHYLRRDEIDRSQFTLPEVLSNSLARDLRNPLNIVLQNLLREYSCKEHAYA